MQYFPLRPRRLTWRSALLCAPLLLVIWMGISSNENLRRFKERVNISDRIFLLLGVSTELFTALQDAESGQRGFLLTGEESYLTPYLAAVKRINGTFPRLMLIANVIPNGRQRLERLKALSGAKLAQMQKTIDAERSDGGAAALKVVETDAGQHEMDQIRKEIVAFLRDGYLAREAERNAGAKATSRTNLVITLGAVALFLLLVFATILIERDRQRQRADALHIQELNQTLENNVRDLSRSHADLEQVTWAASHDLKEPLRMVTAYSQLLVRRRSSASEDEVEFSRFIGEGVERITALIDGLLSYARNLRVPPGNSTHTEADTAAREALGTLMNRIEERSAAIIIDPLPPVKIEPEALRNVFEQLILNALEFSREGVPPRIHVTSLRQADAVRFAIEDNGIGIEPEHHQRIFQLFRRLHGAEYPGIGVGLPLSKRLIENYGGQVWLESEPGVGSTFYFTLPAADSALVAAS